MRSPHRKSQNNLEEDKQLEIQALSTIIGFIRTRLREIIADMNVLIKINSDSKK